MTPQRNRRIRRIGALVLATLTLAACNGDDGAGATTTFAPPSTNPPLPTTTSTTSPTTTSAEPVATTIPTPTAATDPTSTTEGPKSSAVTTSSIVVIDTDPDSPEVQVMLEDFQTHFDAFLKLGRNPDDLDIIAAVEATVTGGMQARVDQTVELLNERNQISIPNPDVPTEVIVDTSTVTLSEDAAGFDACLIDGDTLVDRDDQNPTVSEPTSRSVTYGLSRVDDVWLVATLQFFTVFEGQVGCA